MARHDYRDPVTGKFGKRSIVPAHGSDAYPVVTERQASRRTTTPPKFGSRHPDFPPGSAPVLTGKSSTIGDDNSEGRTEVYETLPGPEIAATTVSRDTAGGTQRTLTQDVLLADAPAPEFGYGVNSSTLQALDCIKGVRTNVTQDHPPRTGQIVNDQTLGAPGSVTVQTVPAGAPAAPPDFLLVSSEQQPTDTAHSEQTDTRVAAWPTLTTKKLNERGEPVTEVSHKVPAGTPPTADSLLTDETSITAESATRSEQVTATVAARATLNTVEHTKIGRQDTLIPPKFLGTETITRAENIVDPATPPTRTSITVLSSIVKQTSPTKATKTDVTRANDAYPTLAGSTLSTEAGGQVAGVIEQIVTPGTAAASGFLVLSSEVTAISADESQSRTVSVPSFPELAGAGFDSNVPGKFLQGFQLETDEDWVNTTTVPATAQLTTGAGVISCKIAPETPFRGKRVTTRLPAGSTLPTLTTVRRTGKGQYATTVESITDGTAPLPALTGLIEDETSQMAIGGGNFLRTVTTVSDVFAENSFSAEIPNLIPEKFRPLAATRTTASTTAGIASAPTLGTGEFKVVVSQITEQEIRTEITAVDVTTLPALTSLSKNEQGQLVTTVETVGDGTMTLPGISATVNPRLDALGGGLFMRAVATIGGVFTGDEYTAEVPNPIPERFRVLAKTSTHAVTSVGTAAIPTLGTGEFRKSIRQLTDQTIRTEITALDLSVLSVTITSYETIDGIKAAVTETLGTSPQSFTPSALVIEGPSETNLGNGLSILTTKTLPSFDLRHGQTSNDELGVVEKFSTQKMATVTAATLLGTVGVDVTPESATVSLVKTKTLDTAALDAYYKTFGTTIPRINFPDVLVSVAVELETSQGIGTSTETGQATNVGNGSLTLSIPNSSQGSASVIPDVRPIIQSVYAEQVPATEAMFFVPDNTSTAAILSKAGAAAWPVFHPVSHTFICKGEKVAVRASASVRYNASFTDGGLKSLATAQGSGGDQDISSVVRAATLKPTIHGIINLTGTTAVSAPATASAQANIGAIVAERSVSLTCHASVSPTTLAATPGVYTIPTNGVYAYRITAQAYRNGTSPTGYTMVRVVLVDFSLLGIAMASADTPTAALTTDLATGINTLTPYSATPTVTTQPRPLTVIAGQTATLSTAVSGTGPVAYQWYGGTPGSGSGSAIPGATLSTYAATTAGSYYAVATDAFGSVTTAAATVTTTAALAITTQPTNQNVPTNTAAVFSVAATGTGTLTYQWYNAYSGAISGATQSTYTIWSATTVNQGSYYVRVTDANGLLDSNSATLAIVTDISPPTITSQPTSLTIVSGTHYGFSNPVVAFTVVATGGTDLSFQWFKDGVSLGASGATGSGSGYIATNATLSLSGPTTADAGSYTCVISNSLGSVTSAAAVFTVYDVAFAGITSGEYLVANRSFTDEILYHYPVSLTCSPAPAADLVFALSEQVGNPGTTAATGKYKINYIGASPYLTTPQLTVPAGATASNALYYYPPVSALYGGPGTGVVLITAATGTGTVEILVSTTLPGTAA